MWFCDCLIIVIMGCCMYLLSVLGLLCFFVYVYVFSGCRSVMVSWICPYSCRLCNICCAYAEVGLLFRM
jgi:hypothetical protein